MLTETSTITENFQWEFPGGLWGLVAVCGTGLLVIVLSYCFTLVRLPRSMRIFLTVLRAGVVGVIIAALCKPTLVRQLVPERQTNRPKVAVVFDESSSMNVISQWGHTRLDKSIRYWQNVLSKHKDRFEFHTFAFAEELRKIGKTQGVEGDVISKKDLYAIEIRQPAKPEDQAKAKSTHFYKRIADWTNRFSSQRYRAVICLTDGVDTSETGRQNAIEALEANNLPHAFIPMTTPLTSLPSVTIAKLETPSTAAVGAKVPVDMLIRTSGLAESQRLKLVVQDGQRTVFERSLRHYDSSTATESIRFAVAISDQSTHIYRGSILSGSETLASVTWSIQGLRQEKPKILLYQGAMDWGTRHLRSAFDRKDRAQLDIRFHPGCIGYRGGRRTRARGRENLEEAFPGRLQLESYDVVILLNVSRQQISSKMEKDISEFVRNGGGVLFLNANPFAAKEFAKSELERLLPVTFSQYTGPVDPVNSGSRWFDNHRKNHKNTPWLLAREDSLVAQQQNRNTAAPLHSFVLTRDGKASPIFNFAITNGRVNPKLLPKYQDRAYIAKRKLGATVLAVAGRRERSDDSGILMATQSYGNGRSALLATDALWRWRLSLSSESSAFETFWRQLVAWLSAGHRRQPAWILNSAIIAADKPTEVRFNLPAGSGYKHEEVEFSLQCGVKQKPLTMTTTEKPGVYKGTVTVAQGEKLRLVARKEGKVLTEAYLTGRPRLAGQELRVLRPDQTGLSALASASRGVVVEQERDFEWESWLPESKPEAVKLADVPLWHRPWVLGLLLGLFGLELLIRRLYRMI